MMTTLGSATNAQRERLLELIFQQLGDDTQSAFESLGITREDFVQLYHTTGEVRVVIQDDQVGGFVWIEHRERELHIHGIVLLEEWRGRGIGSEVLRLLESEFGNDVKYIELGVQTSNRCAQRFYQRVGFLPIDCEMPPGFALLRKTVACE